MMRLSDDAPKIRTLEGIRRKFGRILESCRRLQQMVEQTATGRNTTMTEDADNRQRELYDEHRKHGPSRNTVNVLKRTSSRIR